MTPSEWLLDQFDQEYADHVLGIDGRGVTPRYFIDLFENHCFDPEEEWDHQLCLQADGFHMCYDQTVMLSLTIGESPCGSPIAAELSSTSS